MKNILKAISLLFTLFGLIGIAFGGGKAETNLKKVSVPKSTRGRRDKSGKKKRNAIVRAFCKLLHIPPETDTSTTTTTS